MKSKNAVIFRYSGTGNSDAAARECARAFAAEGFSVESAPLKSARIDKAPAALGLCYPVHGFTSPWSVIKFALRLPKGTGASAFIVVGRAGLKWGKFEPPGLAGTAGFLIALILAVKGYRVRGLLSVNMPSNWYSLHPIQRPRNTDAIIRKGRAIILRFAREIARGRRAWINPNNAYEFVFGLALSPISFAYLFYGRFFLAKLFFSNDRCNSCGLCAENCPIGAIKMLGGRSKRP